MNTTTKVFNASIRTTVLTELSLKHDWVDIILVLVMSFVFLIGIIGNCLVIHFFRKVNNKKLSGMHSLIYYLAVVDLFASIVNPFLYIYWQVTFNRSWHFGVIGCKFLPAVTKVSVSISIGIILVITLDRCFVICRPFNGQFTQPFINWSVVLVVTLSVLAEIPSILHHEIIPDWTCAVPELSVPSFVYPVVVIYIVRNFLFLNIFFFTVLFIFKVLHNKKHVTKQQNEIKKKKKITIMLVTMAIVFIILVFPRELLHISYMISNISGNGIPYTKTVRDINTALKVLHMCNSICNVFIYAGLHDRFRKQLYQLLKKLFCFCEYRFYEYKEPSASVSSEREDQNMLQSVDVFHSSRETNI